MFELKNTLVVILDSTFNQYNEHGSHYVDVHVHTETIDWLQSILKNSNQKNIILATHVGPHLMDIDYFNAAQAEKLRETVEKSTPSNQHVRWIFGHHHVNQLTAYTNLGERNKGYLLPAMIIEEKGYFTEIIIDSCGPRFIQHELAY